MGDLLEPPHHGGEFLVAQMLAEEGEAHHVGEAHGEHGALTGGDAVAAQQHVSLDARSQLPAPYVLEQLGHGRDGDVGHAGEGFGRHHRVDLGADHVPRHQLGLGDAGHGGAHDPGQLERRLGVGRTQGLDGQEEPDRFEVEIGEGGVVVVDVGEAERAPEALELRELDTGELRDLGAGVAPPGRDEHAIGHEEVDDTVGHGAVDFVVADIVEVQDLAHTAEGLLLPALLAGHPGERRHRGSPRSSASSHSGRDGRPMSAMSASGGE